MENRVVKILAIDDNKDNLTILKALIMESFPEAIVLTAFTGQKGLEAAEKEEPDVIILDINMPGMDGFETCQKLKADKKLCDIPVVFFTAIKSDKASRIKALESGAEAFLTKPIDESELTAQIREMLRIRASNIQKREDMIRLEEKSQQNEYLFQSLFDHMSSGVAIYKVLNNGSTGKDYIVLDFNKTALQIEGKGKNDVLGKSLYDLRPNIDEYGLIPAFQKAWQTGEPVFYPVKVYIDEKYTSWYENRIFKLPSGEIVAIYDDVTDKMLIQENLQESEAKYRQIADNVTDVIWTTDMDMRTTYISPSVERMLGESPEEHMKKTVEEKLPPDSLKIMHQVFWEELERKKDLKRDKNRSRIIEVEHYRADGSVIWVSMHISLLRDENGNAIGFQGVSRDITERRQMEDKLQQNLKDLLESQRIAHLGTWRLDLATNEVEWSKELYKMYGFDPTLPPPPYTEHMKLFTPESWDRLSTSLDYTRTSGIPYELELETAAIDGSNGWMWVRGEAETDSEGNIVSLWGAAQDITEYKKIEFQIKQSEEKFQLLFDKAPLGYQSLDFDGHFIEVNQKWLDILGYSKEEVIGKWFGDFLCPEYVEGFRKRFPIFKSQGYIHSEFEMLSKDGNRMYIAFEGKIGYGRDGEFKQTHCILQDITNQKKAEKELLDSEERYRYLFEHSGVGIGYYTTDGIVISYNKMAMENLGGKPEDYIGKSIRALFPKKEAEIYLARLEKAISSDTPQDYEDYVVLNSCPKWFSSTFTKVMNAAGAIIGVQIASLDITNRKQAESDLLYLSCHDHLTDLHNRRFFEEEIKRLDVKGNLPLSIIMIDTNGLKITNDSFGHDMGDELLKKAACAIKQACRTEDIIVRYGGDEFVVVLPNTNTDETLKIATSIKEMASRERVANIELSISYGYATKNSTNESIMEILANAENHMYSHKLSERSSMRSKQIEIIMNTLFEKSNRESQHSIRVSKICKAIAVNMKFENQKINQMGLAGLVHDIGKIGIDEKVLNKNGKLDSDEWNEIQKHPEAGWRILSSSNEFAELAQFVLNHHERWDGNGYPNKHKGENVPLEARIISVADAFDAMTSERSYRKALDKDTAIEELKRCSGTQFDPKIIDVFVNQVLTADNDFN